VVLGEGGVPIQVVTLLGEGGQPMQAVVTKDGTPLMAEPGMPITSMVMASPPAPVYTQPMHTQTIMVPGRQPTFVQGFPTTVQGPAVRYTAPPAAYAAPPMEPVSAFQGTMPTVSPVPTHHYGPPTTIVAPPQYMAHGQPVMTQPFGGQPVGTQPFRGQPVVTQPFGGTMPMGTYSAASGYPSASSALGPGGLAMRGGLLKAGSITDDVFNMVDKNNDGVISRSEFRGALKGNIIAATTGTRTQLGR